MQMTKTQKIIAIIIIVLALFTLYTLITRRTNNIEVSNNIVSSSTTAQLKSGGKIVGNGYTIEEVPVTQSKPTMVVPNLDRPVTPYAGYPVAPEAKASAEKQVASIQSELKKDTKNWSKWINLGIAQKSGGDFMGAILSWKYASFLAPEDYVSLANIGNLYAYFIKDNGQAEVYYKQAIKVGPTQVYLYTQLSEVYIDVFQDINKAKAIIEEGLKQVPNDSLLIQIKVNLSK